MGTGESDAMINCLNMGRLNSLKMKKITFIIILGLIIFGIALFFIFNTSDRTVKCYNEGEEFNTLDNPDAKCCSGLTQITSGFPEEPIGSPDTCIAPTCPCYVCTKCGDKVCGIGENWCNCPEDCEKPKEVPCLADKDCGNNTCSQGRNICYEIRYDCKAGECHSDTTTYENYTCVDGVCKYTCGDGICDPKEMGWWCNDCS